MVEFQRFPPPSSRGLGRSPLKAKTGVRVPLGAYQKTTIIGRFLIQENRIAILHRMLMKLDFCLYGAIRPVKDLMTICLNQHV